MDSRILPPSPHVFANEAEVEQLRLAAVEGAGFAAGAPALRVMMVTEELELLQIHRPKGSADPVHVHHDHDTVAYLVSGRLRLHIGGEVFEARPGAVWRHQRGVPHWTEALEDSVQVEVKSPPCRTW